MKNRQKYKNKIEEKKNNYARKKKKKANFRQHSQAIALRTLFLLTSILQYYSYKDTFNE